MRLIGIDSQQEQWLGQAPGEESQSLCFQGFLLTYQIFAQGDAVTAPYSTLPPRLTKWRNALDPWPEFRRKVNLAGLVVLAGVAYLLALLVPSFGFRMVKDFRA
ncbi:MAG: hypothetical protein Q8O52_12660 [Sulfuritalea sp.]|nr:hypothetical protein [Sulfuritalea sp.]